MNKRRIIFFVIFSVLLIGILIALFLNSSGIETPTAPGNNGTAGSPDSISSGTSIKYKPIPTTPWSYFVGPIFGVRGMRDVDLSMRLEPNMSGITYRYNTVGEVYFACKNYLREHGIDLDKYNISISVNPVIVKINHTDYIFDHVVFIRATNYGAEPYAAIRVGMDALLGRVVFYNLPVDKNTFNQANSSADNALSLTLSLLDRDPRSFGYSFVFTSSWTMPSPPGPVIYEYTVYEYNVEINGEKTFLWSDLLPSVNPAVYITLTRVNDKYFVSYREQYLLPINIVKDVNKSCRDLEVNSSVEKIFNESNIYDYTLFSYSVKAKEKVYVMALVNESGDIVYSFIPANLYTVDIVYGNGTIVFTSTVKLVYSLIDCRLLSYEVRSPNVEG